MNPITQEIPAFGQHTMPTPTTLGWIIPIGKDFVGWNTKRDGTGTWYNGTVSFEGLNQDTLELYAQWGDAPCTLTWNANGGKPATQTTSVSKNSAIGTLPKATRAAYTLSGWYTATSGGDKITNTTTVA